MILSFIQKFTSPSRQKYPVSLKPAAVAKHIMKGKIRQRERPRARKRERERVQSLKNQRWVDGLVSMNARGRRKGERRENK